MAIYPDNAVGSFTVVGFSSMADRKPDRGFSEGVEFDVVSFKSEAGYEKRRLRSRRGMRTFDVQYSTVNGLMREAIYNFYKARSGTFESFTLDLAHFGQAGTATVRFEGSLSISEIKTGTSNILTNYYDVSFKLQETYD